MAMATHDVTDTNVMGEINVTPMVDVMLVLLIIFMVITPALLAGFQAQLPIGQNLQDHPEKDTQTELGIDRFGSYYLNKKEVPGCDGATRATPAGKASCDQIISNLLVQDFQKHPKDHRLFLKADQQVKYKEVLHVFDLAKTAGARMVAEVSEQKPGTEPKDGTGGG